MDIANIKRVIVSEEKLKQRILELGKRISEDYAGKELVLVGVLKGSIYFLTDLSIAIDLPLQIDLMSIGVFSNSTGKTGVVRITKDMDYDITGRHVIVVQDIIRSGLTSGYLLQNFETRGAASIKLCSLLYSPEEFILNFPITYYGFEVSKASWLVGYGLDIEEKGRNLPYIAEIKGMRA
ncbi:MAG TPA: hypoxanthine phosphoribosyltransferase [Negativicutes bacterium]|nr:hypoxanthine phosphoribosyltransferase [Negativicutes bacterium]